MKWDKVSCGFDIEEETRNFGTRAAALGEDAIFESSTLAVIESSNTEILKERPWCKAKCHRLGFALVLDTLIVVFNENLCQLMLNLNFGSTVEDIEWTQDGQFIYVGLQSGALFAVHVQTEVLVRLSKNLNSSQNDYQENWPFYTKIKSYCAENILDVVVVTSSGKIIRINGMCRKDIVECCNSNEEATVKSKEVSKIISRSLKFDVLHSPSYVNRPVKVVDDSYPSIGNNLIIFSGNSIQVWTRNDCFTCSASYPSSVRSDQVLEAFISPDQHFIICLLNTGAIYYINMYTFEFIFVKRDINVINFSFVISGERGDDCKILLHTKNPDRDLCLLAYPDSKLYFKLSDTSDIVLPHGLEEHLYYIELFGEDAVNTIKIKTIVENEPKFRLERLLQRGKFSEAEEFARCFNLAMDDVNQCKASHIADDISIWRQGNYSDNEIEELFQKLIDILNQIDDLTFVVTLCKNSVPCKLDFISKLLKYASSRLEKVNTQESINYVQHYKEIYTLNKLFSNFSRLKNISHCPTSWAEFSSSNFFKDCQNYIAKGDVKSAAILCRGHWNEISTGMSPELGITLLNRLPLHLPKSDIFYWLNLYVPLYLSLHEDSLRLFTQWTVDTIDEMGCAQRDIETCHDLANEILKILHSSFMECYYLPCTLLPLANYLKDRAGLLKKFIYLKNEHNIIIPFDRMPSTEEKIAFIISTLENVPIDGVKVFMEQFVIPYCSVHSLRCDEIILNFIKSSKVIGFSKEEWETRCIKYTELIYNKSERMEAILYILSQASIPWSSTISEFEILSSKTSNDYFKKEIFNIKKTSLIQTILLKYGLPRYALVNVNYSRISCIIKFANYNTHNKTDILGEMRQLVQLEHSSELFTLYSAYLCRSLSEGSLKDILKSIEREIEGNNEIISDLYVWCANYLDETPPYTFENESLEVDMVLSWINYKLPEKRLPFNYMHIIKWLWVNFKVKIEIDHLFSLKSKIILVKRCICLLLENYINKLSDDINVLTYIIDKMKNLARKLDIPVWIVYYELVLEAINIDEIKIAVESMRLLTLENTAKIIPADKISQLAKQVLRNHKKDMFEYMDLYEALSLLMKTQSYCDYGHFFLDEWDVHNILIELLCEDNFKKPAWYIGSMYIDAISLPTEISNQELSLLYKMLSEGSEYFEERNTADVCENFLSELLKKIPHSIHSIAISLRLKFAFEVRSLINEKELLRIKSVITHMVSNTLLKVIYSNSFDLCVALSLLNYFSQEHVLKWIDNVVLKTEVFRLHNLSHLARVYCFSKHLPNQLKEFSQIFNISIWERKFQKFGLSFQNIFADDSVKVSTFKSLLKLQDFNCSILENYCVSFACDTQQYLLAYLSQLLLTWKLDFTINDGEITIKSTHGDLYEKCRDIAIKVNPDNLTQYIINEVWDKINPYYYEVFSVIINIINEVGKDSQINFTEYEYLLNFLISYRRISTPGEFEQETWKLWTDDDSECHIFERISHFRLPFKRLPTTSDLWDFIKPELTLDTYHRWLAVPFWFGVELLHGKICSQAIKNLKTYYGNKNWDLQVKRKDIMCKIEECVSFMESYEFKTCALYFVVNFVMPPGADQVEAAQHCLFKALDWKNKEDSSLSRERYNKAKKKYLIVYTKHTLNKYNLAKSDYLSIASQPIELIRALYHDPSVVDDFASTGINEAAATIAELYKNPSMLVDIKKELLFKWLSENCSHCSNDSVVEVNFTEENKNNFEILKRAVYMLIGDDKHVYCSSLMNIIFTQGEYSKPVLMKLRALQVLLSIIPHSELSSITGRTTEEIMAYLNDLHFVYELERVGFFISVNGFEKKNKNHLLMDLLSDPSPQKVIIAADIADIYSVECKDIWNKILESLTLFNLVNILKKYLVKISKWSYILNSRIVVNAWNVLLMSYILKANLIEDEKEDFVNLFSNCPVINRIDLSSIPPEIEELLEEIY